MSHDPPTQLALDLGAPAPPTFENYVAGANGEALARLRALAAGERAHRFLHLWGPPGSGRSHLLAALAARLAHARLLGPASDPAEIDALAEAWSAPPAAGAAAPCALLDDVQALDAPRQAAAFRLAVAAQGLPAAALVTAADAPPVQLALRDDLRTRLAAGLVLRLVPADDDDKRAALAAAARARGVAIAPEAIEHMLRQLPRDLRVLMAVLDALDRFAMQQKRAITLPLLREFLQQRLPLSGAVESPPE